MDISITIPKANKYEERRIIKLKNDLTLILDAHILTTHSMLFIFKELTYLVLYIKYVFTSPLMAQPHHARRLSKFILLTKQPLLWR